MVKLFTVSQKGGNGGSLWNNANPNGFFSTLHIEGVKKIWDVRRSPNGRRGSFFDTNIFKWCCAHDRLKFEWRLDLAPEKELFKECEQMNFDLCTYAKAYFTPKIVAVLNSITLEDIADTAILCAEQGLYNCHRLLIALYLKERFPQINVKHLGLAYDRYRNERDAPERISLLNTITYIKKLLQKS
jgi:hypothetical protein